MDNSVKYQHAFEITLQKSHWP